MSPRSRTYIEKVQDDHLIGHALYQVTKWRCHINRIDKRPREYIWVVEEFPDIQQRDGPPDYDVLWARWWRELAPGTPKRFAKLYQDWKDLRERGKLKEAKDVCNRILDLGVVALPLMIEEVEQSDTQMIRAGLRKFLSGGRCQPTKLSLRKSKSPL